MTEIKVGQVWQEVDPRVSRFVRIVRLDEDRAGIQTIMKVYPSGWMSLPGASVRAARRERFNGKRSGYALYEDCP